MSDPTPSETQRILAKKKRRALWRKLLLGGVLGPIVILSVLSTFSFISDDTFRTWGELWGWFMWLVWPWMSWLIAWWIAARNAVGREALVSGEAHQAAQQQLDQPAPVYFAVTTAKLALLSITSFGLYELLWFYKNWSLEKDRTNERLSPFWRMVLTPIFAYDLFNRVNTFTGNVGEILSLREEFDHPRIRLKYSPAFFAVWYFLLVCVGRGPLLLPAILLRVAILVSIQGSVNQINKLYAPLADANAKFSRANIVMTIVGGLLVASQLVNIVRD